MEEDERWNEVSDKHCYDFLMKKIPERINEINTHLIDKHLSSDELPVKLQQATDKKNAALEELEILKDERKEMKAKLEQAQDETKKKRDEINRLKGEIELAAPKINQLSDELVKKRN